MTPVTPSDPRLTFDPITIVECLKLMNMYELYILCIYRSRLFSEIIF